MALKIGVIGCGVMAERFHLPSLRYCQSVLDVEVPWCCDLQLDKATAAARLFGAQALVEFERALDEHPVDACMVLVRVQDTFNVVRRLLARGVATFLEKPPAANLAQARDLAELAGRSNMPSQVAFNRRHNPRLAAAIEHLGGPANVTAITYEMFRVARREPTFPAYTMIHAVDAVRHIAGQPAEWTILGRDDPAAWSVAGRFDSGVLATLAVYPDAGIATERCTLHCPGRSAFVSGLHYGTADGLGHAELYQGRKLVRRVEPDLSLPSELQPAAAAGFVDQLRSFVEALLSGRQPKPDLAEAAKTMTWIDQMLSRLGLAWPE